MKSYTNIEQSKKLSEILSLESADMCWVSNGLGKPFVRTIPIKGDPEELCTCWSLAALLNIIPFGCNIERTKRSVTMIYYYKKKEVTVFSDNFVDACVEMILKLNELDLL